MRCGALGPHYLYYLHSIMTNIQPAEMSKAKKIAQSSSGNKPFRMPENFSEFLIQEKKDIQEERRKQRKLPMHKRGLKPRETSHNIMAGLLKEIEEEEWKEGLANVKLKARKKLQTKKVQSVLFKLGTRREFHDMEQEKCRVQLFIEEGQKKIKSVKKQMRSMEEEKAKAENCFSDEAFNEYVNEEVKKTNLALKRAKEVEEAWMEIEEEVNRMSEQVMEVKMDIAKLQKELIHCDMSRDFLWELSPPEWQEQQEARNRIADKISAGAKVKESAQMERNTGSNTVLPPIHQNPNTKFFDQNHNFRKKTAEEEEEGTVGNLEFYKKPQTFFTNHDQLLKCMEKMECEITQYFEELSFTERDIETCELERHNWNQSVEIEDKCLTEEIEKLIRQIKKEEAKVEHLQEQIKNWKENEGLKKIDKELGLVQNKIKEMCSTYTGGLTDSFSFSQVLGDVDIYMCELLEELDKVPKEKLKSIMKAFHKEKAIRLRREEMRRKEMIKEEEWRRRAEMRKQWANKEVMKPVGKKEMWRSSVEKKPPKVAKSKVRGMTEEQELERFLLE